MPLSKTIEDKEFGEVKLSKYKKSKYIKVKVSHDAKVSLAMPYFVPYNEALNFLNEKRLWVKEELEKLNKHKKQLKFIHPKGVIEIPSINNENKIIETEFSTKFRKLELIPCDIKKASYRLSPSKIKVYLPSLRVHGVDAAIQFNDEVDCHDGVIKEAIEAALKREAHNYLPRRLKTLAEKHGLKYHGLSLRNTKTRWGSCTADNKINLCIHLMKLPDELIDYVLLHELAHTVEKNHSAKFWSLLTQMLGTNAKVVDKKLKSYSTELIFAL